MEPTQSRRWGTGEWLILAACLALYLAAVRPFYGVTADDAFISFRYAQNWVAGCGPVYNCGQPPVEGYSNFLWTAISALVIALGQDVVPLMRGLGLGCGFAALVVAIFICRRLWRSRAAMAIPILAVGANPFWAVNAVTGLETSAAALSVLVAALLSLDLVGRTGRRRTYSAGLAWGVSYLMRPEAMALSVVTALWALVVGLRRGGGRKEAITTVLKFGAGFIVVAGPYFVWRILYYQSLLPNTYYAKQGILLEVVNRNAKILAEHPFFFVSLMLAVAISLAWRRRAGQVLLVLLALASAAIALSVHNNFWMPGHRLYLSAFLLLSVVAGGVADLTLRTDRPRWLLAAPVAIFLTLLIILNWANYPHVKFQADLHYAEDDHQAKAMGQTIKVRARKGDWLAIRDAGMVPFYAGPGVNVLDMHENSLNDSTIARQGWNVRHIIKHSPRFIVLMSLHHNILFFTHPNENKLSQAMARDRGYRHVMTATWHAYRHFFLYARP